MNKQLHLLLIFMLLLVFCRAFLAESEEVRGIYIYIIHDPLANEGTLTINITIESNDPVYISLPITILGEYVEATFLFNEITGNASLISLDYSEQNKYIQVIIMGNGSLVLHLGIKNLLEEYGIGSYSAYINTALLSNITHKLKLELVMPGYFDVDSVNIIGTSEISIKKEKNTTRITIDGFSETILTLISTIEETITPTPSQFPDWKITLVVFLTIGGVAGGFTLYYILRKREKIVLERVDYMYDDITRSILKILKEAGSRGLTQAEIVKLTNFPKSSISRRIRRLEDEGLIEVKRSGKYNYVSLTSKGLELVKKLTERVEK